ncbi:MAG: DUF309 domain-containing protein [Chloroflexi bacterium]|nr:DUF309 domain-containing protein [Chloroflexota bacterium]MCC6894769.1 DUF309 domain-containing protein [Anaerolineae bacterium]
MPNPTIIIAGTPTWEADLRQQLPETYHLITYTVPANYVTRLADDHAALVLVDGDADGWRFYTTTPKTSSATRRIPILLIAEDDEARGTALGAGADLALTPAELLAQLPALLADYARVLDSATAEQLDCECQEALPPLAAQAVEKFNAREFYPQHDLFEEQWMHTTGPVRDLYRAVLQVGIAYYQIERGNHRGSLKMLLRSVQWFALLPDVCQGIDVRQLREDSTAVRAALEKLDAADIDQFDMALLKPVRLVGKS